MINARSPGAAFRSLVLAAAIAFAAGAGLASGTAGAQGSSSINIPFERYTLPNGLTVITSLDRTAPTVAVNMWYHVGLAIVVVGDRASIEGPLKATKIAPISSLDIEGAQKTP